MKQILIILASFAYSISLFAATFTVTNTNNSGSGSLRDAIQSAAFTSGPHSIVFNIPMSDPNYNSSTGVWKITPQTTFSYIIKNNVTIDGTTQTANQGDTNPYGPEIVLDGNNNTINYCFSVFNASNVIIKGFNIRRFMYGIQISGTSAKYGSIFGNYIGTNETGSDSAGNYIGIEIIAGADYTNIGGSSLTERNIVSGNQHIGIRLLDVKFCNVKGNYVGVNRLGNAAIPNYDGVSLEGAVKFCTIGGYTSNERNIISGNVAYGLPVFGAGAEGNIIIGNYIGTDINGTFSIPNTYGVLFDDGSFNNILGGSGAGATNVLSGNSAYGVFIYNMGTNSNIIKGNLIGVDATGTLAVPNAVGIVVDGAAYKHIIDSNIISGNLQQGIYINITGSDSTQITRNNIGVDKNGNAMGNGSDGIRISQGPKYSLIGGLPSQANQIANNGGNGVYIMFNNDDYHLISCNSIYNNGGLGIDLFPQGPNLNDAGDGDTGPNEGMNFPVIDTVIYLTAGLQTVIQGHLDTQSPELCTVQLFKAQVNNSGYGEGILYLFSVFTNASGYWEDTLTGLTPTDFITAIAISPSNNTSEFSLARNTTTIANTSINQIESDLRIYPNPSSDYLNVFVENSESSKSLCLVDYLGKKVLNINLKESLSQIDIHNLPVGVYFVVIKLDNGDTFTEKWVKIK